MTTDDAMGAVDLDACPNPTSRRRGTIRCACRPKCVVCDFPKHTAIHGPAFGALPGSKPVGHVFRAKPEELR